MRILSLHLQGRLLSWFAEDLKTPTKITIRLNQIKLEGVENMSQEQLARFKKYLKDKLIELSNEDGEFELGEWSAYEHMDKVLWLMTGDSDDGD